MSDLLTPRPKTGYEDYLNSTHNRQGTIGIDHGRKNDPTDDRRGVFEGGEFKGQTPEQAGEALRDRFVKTGSNEAPATHGLDYVRQGQSVDRPDRQAWGSAESVVKRQNEWTERANMRDVRTDAEIDAENEWRKTQEQAILGEGQPGQGAAPPMFARDGSPINPNAVQEFHAAADKIINAPPTKPRPVLDGAAAKRQSEWEAKRTAAQAGFAMSKGLENISDQPAAPAALPPVTATTQVGEVKVGVNPNGTRSVTGPSGAGRSVPLPSLAPPSPVPNIPSLGGIGANSIGASNPALAVQPGASAYQQPAAAVQSFATPPAAPQRGQGQSRKVVDEPPREGQAGYLRPAQQGSPGQLPQRTTEDAYKVINALKPSRPTPIKGSRYFPESVAAAARTFRPGFNQVPETSKAYGG